MKKPVIYCEQFGFQYDSQKEPTLKNIHLSIEQGETVLILGPSGSGKSTLGHLINGLASNAYKGTVTGRMEVAGHPVGQTDIFTLSNEVGTVLQDTDGQFLGLTVAEDIAFALENLAVDGTTMHQKVQYWAEKVRLNQLLAHRPQDLSGGQKQRVSMAGVMIGETPILLFDEPLANLDPKTGKEAMELIEELKNELSATVVIIEHRLEDVLHCKVDRIIVMQEGQIISDSTPQKLLTSDTLAQMGIREPLYISAMRYAGLDLANFHPIDSLANLDLAIQKEKFQNWQKAQSQKILSQQTKPLLELDRISCGYGQKLILKNLSMSIHQGEMVAIVGENGAGKSTLIKLICGFIPLQNGRMQFKGNDLTKDSIKERADKIGYVMQNPNQMISQNIVFDEIALGLKLRGVDQETIQQKVHEVLKICGLFPFRNWPIQALSYGQKKRVTIASMLALEPEILILDEPTAGQDLAHYTQMMDFLEQLNRQGVTIILVTHDMHLMLEYTTRSLVMVDGQVIADLTPAQLLTNQKLIDQASLKETSLYTLALKLHLENPSQFVQTFIDYEKANKVRVCDDK
ncbi:ABC transporter ATP-binding protein [uncultured Enterococcus sp.]|uniref:ABC transporter ATP-binding protein n=1 Tax=uncultured Enterococcus sp. TaxID=167972 RepID=UPI00263752A2|nr:ABC transporter ATP-binding protein [uncultured Enterococcus sp.]